MYRGSIIVDVQQNMDFLPDSQTTKVQYDTVYVIWAHKHYTIH